ncbi:uncharacterized protein BP5553_06672 [Venustampulla echinocandica]|uniref:Uncharacterized protein n=1 Tax=Venustampulla echinocandica TaxID=2656787 RepID=A0A370TKK4_9HELO|nr:uncharacterized protein BP5553_06672 [Venustampulla echinocandica]RDL36060.1 hypothetical protein BP5553_06672 [Venustampulla echinocandica]
MEIVSVVLLATLLPTCLLILMLGSLAIYLFLRLRQSRDECRTLSTNPPAPAPASAPTPAPVPLTAETRYRRPDTRQRFLEHQMGFSEFSPFDSPNPTSDFWEMQAFGGWISVEVDHSDSAGDSEDRISPILERLGYKSLPVTIICRLLENHNTREHVLEHLFYDVAFNRTSLDGDPQFSILPFTPQEHLDLRASFETLKGMQLSPSVASALGKSILDLASKDKWPNDNLDSISNAFWKLTRHYSGGSIEQKYRIRHDGLLEEFTTWLCGRLRFMAQFQQVELRWLECSSGESLPTSFPLLPELCTFVGDDGEVLKEPKVLVRGKTISILEDGSIENGYFPEKH